MTSSIRVATPADVDALCALVAGFRDHLKRTAPTNDEIASYLPTALADPETEFACAFAADETPLGYAQTLFFPSVWAVGLEALLEDLFVAPRARGTGLGRALLEFVTSRAVERGARAMGLNTNERNEPALRLYRSAGFRLVEEPRWDGGHEVRLSKSLVPGPRS